MYKSFGEFYKGLVQILMKITQLSGDKPVSYGEKYEKE